MKDYINFLQKNRVKLLVVLVPICILLFIFKLDIQSSHGENTNLANEKPSVVLYTKAGCRYCMLAEDLLQKRGVDYKIVELTDKKDLIIKLVRATKQKTVPYVFVNEKFIGGYNDLMQLDKKGKL